MHGIAFALTLQLCGSPGTNSERDQRGTKFFRGFERVVLEEVPEELLLAASAVDRRRTKEVISS